MVAQWKTGLSSEKYGKVVYEESLDVISVFATDFTFGGCVLGLACLWIIFRVATVISLTLQDKAY